MRNRKPIMTPGSKEMGAIVEALGLPPNTSGFEMKVAHDQFPELTVTYHPEVPTSDQVGDLGLVTGKFFLITADDKQALLSKLAAELGYDLIPSLNGRGSAWRHESLQQEIVESRDGPDHVKKWDEFWKELCTNPDGTINLDSVQRELADYSVLLGYTVHVYEHVTGGMATKPFTWPSVICSLADEYTNRICDDALEEERGENATTPSEVGNG